MNLHQDVQQLAGDAIIELFVVDATALGGTLYRFHANTNQLKASLVWAGNVYAAMPLEVTGFEFTGTGKLPRPTMRMQNVDGLVGALADTYDDLLGTRVTRVRTLAKYLDAVNFPGGVNPTADPTALFPDDVFYINRKTVHTKTAIEFELASSLDMQNVKIPRRQIIQHVCTWRYRSAECSYVGGAVATIGDVPTTNLLLDQCGKRVSSCQLRFGVTGVLPYGGFVGAGVVTR